MKGIIFTEFLEMVEDRFGLEMVDRIIEQSDLESSGAYTAVGTYGHDELLQLVCQLSASLAIPVPDLVRAFAHHLFKSFTSTYPYVLEGLNSSIEMLQNVEDFIHVEVKKLYPDAELPTIGFRKLREDCWELTYRSRRPFADLCEGLIEACINHFGDDVHLEREDLDVDEGSAARFILHVTREAATCTNLTS
ncbi:MAG: heme NO-binding domain-containing protein [Planctomycetota bacterium]|nr:heme NO-binding domain-containing protein [Planctomycetota bacterium]